MQVREAKPDRRTSTRGHSNHLKEETQKDSEIMGGLWELSWQKEDCYS